MSSVRPDRTDRISLVLASPAPDPPPARRCGRAPWSGSGPCRRRRGRRRRSRCRAPRRRTAPSAMRAPVRSGCTLASSWLMPSGNTATRPPLASSARQVRKAASLRSTGARSRRRRPSCGARVPRRRGAGTGPAAGCGRAWSCPGTVDSGERRHQHQPVDETVDVVGDEHDRAGGHALGALDVDAAEEDARQEPCQLRHHAVPGPCRHRPPPKSTSTPCFDAVPCADHRARVRSADDAHPRRPRRRRAGMQLDLETYKRHAGRVDLEGIDFDAFRRPSRRRHPAVSALHARRRASHRLLPARSARHARPPRPGPHDVPDDLDLRGVLARRGDRNGAQGPRRAGRRRPHRAVAEAPAGGTGWRPLCTASARRS